MSKLEKFIKENRSAFDEAVPGAAIWDRVEASLPDRKQTKLRALYRWSAAAAAVLLVGTGLYFFVFRQPQPDRYLATNPQHIDTAIVRLAPDEAPQMFHFTKMIDEKQEELKKLSKEQPELYHQFIKDVTQLDSSYKVLRDKLKISPNREMLVEAMIQNLQLQLNVLNQQLNIIKQIKEHKTTNI